MNVVLAGECGAGKSSLINLIVGRDVAQTSNDTGACTTEARSYRASINGYNLNLWDTPGLDEGTTTRPLANARFPERLTKSLHQLKNRENIHLIVYCMHGNRAKAALLKHYETIRDSAPLTVPIVAVITRLERYPNHMEEWWSNNAQELASLGLNFVDHACITTIPDGRGLSDAFRERLVQSQRVVTDLIRRNCIPQSAADLSATPIPKLAIYGLKDSEDIVSRAMNMQISSLRALTNLHLRTVPRTLFASA